MYLEGQSYQISRKSEFCPHYDDDILAGLVPSCCCIASIPITVAPTNSWSHYSPPPPPPSPADRHCRLSPGAVPAVVPQVVLHTRPGQEYHGARLVIQVGVCVVREAGGNICRYKDKKRLEISWWWSCPPYLGWYSLRVRQNLYCRPGQGVAAGGDTRHTSLSWLLHWLHSRPTTAQVTWVRYP